MPGEIKKGPKVPFKKVLEGDAWVVRYTCKNRDCRWSYEERAIYYEKRRHCCNCDAVMHAQKVGLVSEVKEGN